MLLVSSGFTMKRLILIILLLFPMATYAYTSPGKPAGFVSDFVGALSDSAEHELEAFLTDYEKQTGNEISVVIIMHV